MTRNDSVDRFMCGLIVVVEDLVHFMSNNNATFISQVKLASKGKLYCHKCLMLFDMSPNE